MTTDWRTQAACRGMDVEWFFPERGAATAEQKALCGACHVRAECLDDALRSGAVGVAGGLTEQERRKLGGTRRVGPRPAVAACGSVSGYNAHRRKGEPTCGPCRAANATAKAEYEAQHPRRSQAKAVAS